jgi:hypothetical protein
MAANVTAAVKFAKFPTKITSGFQGAHAWTAVKFATKTMHGKVASAGNAAKFATNTMYGKAASVRHAARVVTKTMLSMRTAKYVPNAVKPVAKPMTGQRIVSGVLGARILSLATDGTKISV